MDRHSVHLEVAVAVLAVLTLVLIPGFSAAALIAIAVLGLLLYGVIEYVAASGREAGAG